MLQSRDKLLSVRPGELTFPFELEKRPSCKIQLSNNTPVTVAFKVMTKTPMKYAVQPKHGIILARSTFDITVESLTGTHPEVECKDKFLIMNAVAKAGTTTQNAWKLFEEPRHEGEDSILTVKYVLISQSESPHSVTSMNLSTMEQGSLNHHKTESSNPASVSVTSASTVQERELNHPKGENDPRGDLWTSVIAIGLLGLGAWFLIRIMLPLIWSFMRLIMGLVKKMADKLLSDSVEEWILKILCYVFGRFISSVF